MDAVAQVLGAHLGAGTHMAASRRGIDVRAEPRLAVTQIVSPARPGPGSKAQFTHGGSQ